MTPPHVPHGAPPENYEGPRRALILAGGGLRLSYQAGVIRALLDDGLTFAHIDGTSGGGINLAQLLSGLNPEEMCARWRTLPNRDTVSLTPHNRVAGFGVALGGTRAMRRRAFPHLGIDFERIRAATGLEATFNVLDYARKVVRSVPHTEVDEDVLIAGMSLPGVFPPVRKDEGLLLDTAFVQDANLMEAVRRGADELWVVWILGNTATYRGGPLRLYTQMLEMSANGALNVDFDRIRLLNEGRSEPIRLHVILPAHPLPLDPSLYTGAVDHGTLIDQGYADACAYLANHRESGVAPKPATIMMRETGPNVTFRERLSGPFRLEDRPATRLRIDMGVTIRDVARALADPEYPSSATGRLSLDPFGSDVPANRASHRTSGYELHFEPDDEPYYLAAERVAFDRFEAVLHRGSGPGAPAVGRGELYLDRAAQVRLLWSIRTSGVGSLGAKLRAYRAFAGRVLAGISGA